MKKLSSPFSRDNRPLWIAGGAAFLLSAVANAPASLAAAIATANSPLLTIGGAKGSIWRGEWSRVVYNRILIGDIEYRLEPAGLLAGRIVADASSSNGALAGKARISFSSFSVELKDATAQFNLSAIRQYTFFGARYQGTASLRAKSMALTRKGCRAQRAEVSTNALDVLAKQWSGAAFPLAGEIECVEGKLNLTLAGRNADGGARVDISISPDLAYTMTMTAEPKRAEVGDALRLFGFEGEGARLSYRAVGQLKGLSS
ncbi:MAG: type II secretion system protein N [Pseudomonadota bacterium]